MASVSQNTIFIILWVCVFPNIQYLIVKALPRAVSPSLLHFLCALHGWTISINSTLSTVHLSSTLSMYWPLEHANFVSSVNKLKTWSVCNMELEYRTHPRFSHHSQSVMTSFLIIKQKIINDMLWASISKSYCPFS